MAIQKPAKPVNGQGSAVVDNEARNRRKWLFPRLPLKDVAIFIEKIATDGSGEKMRRTALLDKLGLGNSGHTREKITVSQAYGLTVGNQGAEFIEPTALGLSYADSHDKACVMLEIIRTNDKFRQFHTRYADKRVPSKELLLDWAKQIGIDGDQTKEFVEVVLENGRAAGLIKTLSGAETFISFDHAQEQLANSSSRNGASASWDSEAHPAVIIEPPIDGNPQPSVGRTRTSFTVPDVHIDVQIHIDANASVEQIDAIFTSMAKYLYGNDNEDK